MIVRPSVSKIEKAKSRKLCSEIASCAAFLSVMEPDSSASSAFTVVRKDSASSDSVLSVRRIAFWRRITYVAMASTMSTHVSAAGVTRKKFDQSILFCCKRYRPAPPRNILSNRIHYQVCHDDFCRL